MKIAVSTAFGLEAVCKRELYKLGVEDAPAINGRLIFDGDMETVAKCNLFLRSASRVLIVLAEFKAQNFDQLFDGVEKVDFAKFLPVDAKIIVEAKCVRSTIYAISATQSIVKKAVCQKLSKQYSGAQLTETGERYKIEISIFKDFVSVCLDTSGDGLHKRGYRNLAYDAPLKENVASALIQLSVWNPSRPFADLFCGSGTLPIEAAMIARGIPSGAYRDFDFLHWKKFDRTFFDNLKRQAMNSLNDVSGVKICGFDISDKAISLAREHAKNAGVADVIHFQRADMADFSSKDKRGVIISNPPYGERLSEREEIESLYRALGKKAKELTDWCFYTLTPVGDFERLFGKKADKKRKLFNGNIECFYYQHLAEITKKQ